MHNLWLITDATVTRIPPLAKTSNAAENSISSEPSAIVIYVGEDDWVKNEVVVRTSAVFVMRDQPSIWTVHYRERKRCGNEKKTGFAFRDLHLDLYVSGFRIIGDRRRSHAQT